MAFLSGTGLCRSKPKESGQQSSRRLRHLRLRGWLNQRSLLSSLRDRRGGRRELALEGPPFLLLPIQPPTQIVHRLSMRLTLTLAVFALAAELPFKHVGFGLDGGEFHPKRGDLRSTLPDDGFRLRTQGFQNGNVVLLRERPA
jgi:hypothetical protein